ncbi:ubiquitin carrier protein [Fusarium austroafricanum]|uniref:Ubiquitin carrier protein n=1 Tax=Fusarium austroafricanum TaxID=2364996 RepID=A0A8H4K830_9HYPO|nr:ubiquitin carrier protein [Fusarium austroafricanum]
MLSHAGSLLMRRGEMGKPDLGHELAQLPWWSVFVGIANFLLFFPLLLLINYTFEKVFPVLAIVEDEKPPAYEPLPVEPLADDGMPKPAGTSSAPVAGQGHPVTSSFRATWRLLRSTGGFGALFRGFPCFMAQAIVTGLINGIMYTFTPYSFVLSSLIGSLVCAQLNTAWVHIVITPHSPLRFWSRLPPFKTTFMATWRPILIFWAASQIVNVGTFAGLHLLGGDKTPELLGLGSVFGILLVAVLLQVAVQIPAYVVLVRVQASLLPADADTIIPFDRSFNGRIEPVVVGGLGYATVRDAWLSFSKSAWRRIVMLSVKIVAISFALLFVMFAIAMPQFILLASMGTSGDEGTGNEDIKM